MSKGKNTLKKETVTVATDNDAKKEVAPPKVEKFSTFIQVLSSVVLALSGLGVSLVNKSMYGRFGDIDPMNLLFVQTAVNVSLCLTAVGLKTKGICDFSGLEACGVTVPVYETLAAKQILGLRVGLSNLFTVIFSIFAFKYSTIPV